MIALLRRYEDLVCSVKIRVEVGIGMSRRMYSDLYGLNEAPDPICNFV